MRLNIKKCKVMTINSNDYDPVNINGQAVEEVNSYKYLGIAINNKLKWDQQWQRDHKSISSAPFLLRQLKKLGYKQPVLIAIYRSYVLSHITYSAPVLTSAGSAFNEEINRFQARALRILGLTAEESTVKTTYLASVIYSTTLVPACYSKYFQIPTTQSYQLKQEVTLYQGSI